MGEKRGHFWKATLAVLSCVFFAQLVSCDASKACCSDGLGLNYTLPMLMECKKKEHPDGRTVQTIPKIIPASSETGGCPTRRKTLNIPPGHRVCRFPDCDQQICGNGWCEETMTSYLCHCSSGFKGIHCDHESSSSQDTATTSMTRATTTTTTTTTPIATKTTPRTGE
ncbi:uncharacterized protein LOC115920502 [Strongylocentrotus purpuratus]|uniref:EGF-like domain-containing protein n=1 Tax=Strongylocentrotus purpuratus TaxID=7668 RepID=A0A7M7N780_STRPU|nr:uncharacterized protein LOC115920502 [Strongylocentrotus purpuratus]